MTVSDAVNEINVTVSATLGTEVNIPFLYLALGDIVVIDNGTLKAIDTDYTLTAAGVTTGGTLTTVTAFSAVSLATRIIRSVAKTQLTDYKQTGAFDAESHEVALDRLTMQSQASLSRDTTTAETWDAQSDKIVNVTDPTLAQDAATKNYADGIVASAGNVVAPVNDDLGFHYEATGVGLHAWRVSDEVPDPTSQQVTDTLFTTLRTSSTTKGSLSVWGTTDEIPLPTATQVTRGSRTVVQANSVTLGSHGAFVDLITPSQNFLYNGDFAVPQRGTSFTSATTPANSDDTWLLDRWLLLADGSDTVDVSQDTSVTPDGAFSSIKLEVETANRKFAICQILEERDTQRILIDGTTTRVSLSFEARTTATFLIENIRCGIAAWTGTADSVTSDIISTWNAEGATPTLVASWAFEGTTANLAITDNDTFQRFTITNVLIDQAAVNLAVIIWVDDTDAAVNDLLYISKVKLERGPIDTPYQGIRYSDDLAACQRYAVVFEASAASEPFGSGFAQNTALSEVTIHLPVEMRNRSTMTTTFTTTSNFRLAHGTGQDNVTSFGTSVFGNKIVTISATSGTNLTALEGLILEATNSSAKITIDNEL